MEKPSKSFLKALGYAALFLAVQIAVILFFMLGFVFSYFSRYSIDPNIVADPAAYTGLLNDITAQAFTLLAEKMVILNLLSAFLLLLILLIIFRARHKNVFEELSLAPVRRMSDLLFPLLSGATVYYFIVSALCLLPIPENVLTSHEQVYALLLTGDPYLLVFSLCIVTPVVEEVVFRGLVLSRLKRGMGTVPAVVIQAVFFGLAHANLLSFSYAVLIGLCLGYFAAKAGSVLPCIVFHAVFNAMNLLPDFIGDSRLYAWITLAVSLAASVALFAAFYKKRTVKNSPY